MAKNIAVIGDSESIKGFAAIGMDIYPCDDKENAPGVKGNTGIGIKRLSSFVEKAVGSDIIFND